MRALFALPILLAIAACGEAEAPVESHTAAMDVAMNAIAGEVTLAERLVREALGDSEALTFANPLRSRSQGVTIICGNYTRGDEPARRYIVVDNQDVFVEATMPQADMDASFAEFCTQGAQRPAQPAPPPVLENAQ